MSSCVPNRQIPIETYLDLPTQGGPKVTADAALHTLESGDDVYLLTPSGRAIMCGLLAAQSPWMQYPDSFVTALSSLGGGNITPSKGVNSWPFHFLNLLWRMRNFAFRRSDLLAAMVAMRSAMDRTRHPDWFPQLTEDSDVIQMVNKSGQWGLKHQQFSGQIPDDTDRSVAYYTLAGPLEQEIGKRNPKGYVQPEPPTCDHIVAEADDSIFSITPQEARKKETERAAILDYMKRTWVNVPLEDWTLNGHKDPTNKELPDNLVAQPKDYNRKMRNKWKFDEFGLPWCPSVEHLAKQLDTFYPSEIERRMLFEALAKDLGLEITDPASRV
jgi:hypothetical protein